MSAALQALGQFIFGGDGGVTLGGVTLQNFEVPEVIAFGGDLEMEVHKLPGGNKVIDVMGDFDDDITWEGKMLGQNASDRASMLDDMRKDGKEIDLSFGDQHRSVIIKRFIADYRPKHWIGNYKITCVVTDVFEDGNGPTLLGNITNDIQNATGINLPSSLANIGGSLSAVSSALQVVGPLVGNSGGVLALQGVFRQATGVTGGLQSAAEGNMGGLIVAAAASGGNVGGVAGLTSSLSIAEQLAKTTVIKGYLSRSSSNLATGT